MITGAASHSIFDFRAMGISAPGIIVARMAMILPAAGAAVNAGAGNGHASELLGAIDSGHRD